VNKNDVSLQFDDAENEFSSIVQDGMLSIRIKYLFNDDYQQPKCTWILAHEKSFPLP
jgi:hypothetical protein